MGPLTENFANLSLYLTAQRSQERAAPLLIEKLARPLLSREWRLGSGNLVDPRGRMVGPFDVVASADAYPVFGEGMASMYCVDAVAFCLSARDWNAEPLSEFGQQAVQVKKLERKQKTPILCAAVSFTPLPLEQLREFLLGPEGQAVDAVLSIGEHVLVRNGGLYGDPARIPFVSERGAGESLKAFSMLLLQTAEAAQGQPFLLADYQHL